MNNVNQENVQKLIDAISNEDNGFTMEIWVFSDKPCDIPEDGKRGDCGTPACIGGWVTHLIKKTNIITKKANWLGLNSHEELIKLTHPRNYDTDHVKYTRKQAVATLIHLRDTGEINWDIEPYEFQVGDRVEVFSGDRWSEKGWTGTVQHIRNEKHPDGDLNIGFDNNRQWNIHSTQLKLLATVDDKKKDDEKPNWTHDRIEIGKEYKHIHSNQKVKTIGYDHENKKVVVKCLNDNVFGNKDRYVNIGGCIDVWDEIKKPVVTTRVISVKDFIDYSLEESNKIIVKDDPHIIATFEDDKLVKVEASS